ncbi:MAG TPA: sulfatase [Nonomuraea sp.]|nr:sulfatase [Nonomuraea sp.]
MRSQPACGSARSSRKRATSWRDQMAGYLSHGVEHCGLPLVMTTRPRPFGRHTLVRLTDPAVRLVCGAGRSGWRIVLIALCLGLVSGLGEGAMYWFQGVAPTRSGWRGDLLPEILWIAPLFDLALFGTLGVLVAVVGRLSGRAGRYVALAGVFGLTVIAAFGPLLAWPQFHPLALLVLALGASVQAFRFFSARPPTDAGLRRHFLRLTGLLVLANVLGVLFGPSRAARLSSPIAGVPSGVDGILAQTLSRRDFVRGSAAQAPRDRPNVLLIVLDTLRADHLSSYGYQLETTPRMDAFAQQGVLFEKAFASAPWTLPSHASLFTGRYTYEHQASYRPLDATLPTLAERLAVQGYDTGGFVANRSYTNWASGLGRGFRIYDDYYSNAYDMVNITAYGKLLFDQLPLLSYYNKPGRKYADEINREFLTWLDSGSGSPFFAFLNYLDVHYPYIPPPPFDRKFTDDPLDYRISPEFLGPRRESHTPREIQVMKAAYDGSLAYLDDQLGLLFDTLERRGLLDNTLVVITSDHGEEFGEHGSWGHGSSLYREQVHVPLIIRHPATVPPGQRVACTVTNQAVPATVMQLLGAQGGSPFPADPLTVHWADGHDDATCNGVAFSELFSYGETFGGRFKARKALTTRDWRLVLNKTAQMELYRAQEDTAEERDLAASAEGQQALQTLLPRLAPYLSPEDWKGFNLPPGLKP